MSLSAAALLYGRQLVGIRCTGAVCDGTEQYDSPPPARLPCGVLLDRALGFANYFPWLRSWSLGKSMDSAGVSASAEW